MFENDLVGCLSVLDLVFSGGVFTLAFMFVFVVSEVGLEIIGFVC